MHERGVARQTLDRGAIGNVHVLANRIWSSRNTHDLHALPLDRGGNMPTREAVRAEVAKTSGFVGALGSTSFDANGDTSQKIISIYQATGTPVDWVWVKQINYAK